MDTNHPQLSEEDVERFGPLTPFGINLVAVEERILHACIRAGCDGASVPLLPITRAVPADILQYAFKAAYAPLAKTNSRDDDKA